MLLPSPLAGAPSTQQYYIVRVDAPPGVANIAADSCPVTIESGPHHNLALALEALQHPKQRAYVLPDIVFLPTTAPVYALNEPVPHSKPRLVVSAGTVAAARSPAAPPRQQQGASPAARTPQRRGSKDSKGSQAAAAALAAAAAAMFPATPGLQLGDGGLPLEGIGGPLGLQWPPPPPGMAAPLPAGMPLIPLPLAQAAAQVQQMLQQQLAAQQVEGAVQPGLQPPMLLPLQPQAGEVQALPFVVATPLPASLAAGPVQQQLTPAPQHADQDITSGLQSLQQAAAEQPAAQQQPVGQQLQQQEGEREKAAGVEAGVLGLGAGSALPLEPQAQAGSS